MGQRPDLTRLPSRVGAIFQQILDDIEARKSSEGLSNPSPSKQKEEASPSRSGEDMRTTRLESWQPRPALDHLFASSSSPNIGGESPAPLPCMGGCGQLREPFWDDGWRRPSPMCEACEEARSVREHQANLDARWAEARLPERFRGYGLDRAASQLPQESDLEFVRRIEALPHTVGVSRHNVEPVMKLEAWLHTPVRRSSFWLRLRPGFGKTLLLCAIGQKLLEAGEDVLFYPEPDFFGQLSLERHLSLQPGGAMYEARTCGVLLMDGANASPHRVDPPQPWMARALSSLVNARYNAARPILWTSENSLAEYADVWREAFADEPGDGFSGRLCEMCARREILLEGFNWRVTGWEGDFG